MVRRTINLILENEDIALAKAQNLNISAFLREALAIKVGGIKEEHKKDKDDIIIELQTRLANLTVELNMKTDENKKLNREILEKEEKLKEYGKKQPPKRHFINTDY